jgi:hypothetical protein
MVEWGSTSGMIATLSSAINPSKSSGFGSSGLTLRLASSAGVDGGLIGMHAIHYFGNFESLTSGIGSTNPLMEPLSSSGNYFVTYMKGFCTAFTVSYSGDISQT